MNNETSLGVKVGGVVLGVVALVGAGFAGAYINDNNQPITPLVDVDAITANATDQATQNVLDSLGNLTTNVDQIQADVIVLSDEILAEDVLEASAEALALVELEDDTYEELGNWLVSNYSDLDDENDISKVVIRDTDVTIDDLDDNDATVTQEIKVYYENLSGDTVKRYITVTTVIEGGEVESQAFAETI